MKEGLKPRNKRNGKIGYSNYAEYPEILSFIDRSYLGTSSVGGIVKCIQGALMSSRESISNGRIFIFGKSILDLDIVADEDCFYDGEIRNAFQSANYCSSFGVRDIIHPKHIIDSIIINEDNKDEVVKKMCAYSKDTNCEKEIISKKLHIIS